MSKFSILGTLAALMILAGCGGDIPFKQNAQGAAYEIVVVADHDVWDGPAGDSMRAMFYRRFPMVSREETSFDVLRVLPAGFSKLNRLHRNVMITDVNPTYTRATLSMGNDTYASPQIVLRASAPDQSSLAELISMNRDDIMLILENAEKDRDVADARRHTPPEIAKLIREKFGFEMSTGPGYKVRSESEDFVWLSYEMPTSSQGIIIYTYPFSGVKDFDRENLLRRRNEFVERIPGENPGSHMSTHPEMAEVIYKTIEVRPWSEMHGFWDVEGDFMGGPYTNYSTLNAARQRVVAIDFYVYSPGQRSSQRNYIKQLEHFIYTVKISGEIPSFNGAPAAP